MRMLFVLVGSTSRCIYLEIEHRIRTYNFWVVSSTGWYIASSLVRSSPSPPPMACHPKN